MHSQRGVLQGVRFKVIRPAGVTTLGPASRAQTRSRRAAFWPWPGLRPVIRITLNRTPGGLIALLARRTGSQEQYSHTAAAGRFLLRHNGWTGVAIGRRDPGLGGELAMTWYLETPT